jgi:hypothetical protein
MWTKAFAAVLLAGVVAVLVAGLRDTPVRRALVAPPAPAEQALERILPEVWLEDVSFEEAVARLKEVGGVEIFVDWPGLDKAGVVRTVPVTIRRRNGTLAEALTLVLDQAAETARSGRLGFSPQGDLVRVASERSLGLRAMQVRCYDVRDLVAAQGAAGLRLVESGKPTNPPAAIVRLMLDTVAPHTWRDKGGPGVVQAYVDRLVILQTWENHRRVQNLLAVLRHSSAPSPPPAPAPEVRVWHDLLKQWTPLDNGPAEAALERRLPEVSIDADSVEEALEVLHELTGANLLLSDAARRAAFDPRDRVVLRLRDVTLAETLDAMVENCCTWRHLGYTVDRGVIVVTTKEAAARDVFTRVYDLRHWPPLRTAAVDQLIATLKEDIDPSSWQDRGGRGGVRELRGSLVVTQTLANHDKVRRFMNALGAASATTRPAKQGSVP